MSFDLKFSLLRMGIFITIAISLSLFFSIPLISVPILITLAVVLPVSILGIMLRNFLTSTATHNKNDPSDDSSSYSLDRNSYEHSLSKLRKSDDLVPLRGIDGEILHDSNGDIIQVSRSMYDAVHERAYALHEMLSSVGTFKAHQCGDSVENNNIRERAPSL